MSDKDEDEDADLETPVELDDFKQGFLAGWMHAQGWTGIPSFEQFNSAAIAWEAWMESQRTTKQ